MTAAVQLTLSNVVFLQRLQFPIWWWALLLRRCTETVAVEALSAGGFDPLALLNAMAAALPEFSMLYLIEGFVKDVSNLIRRKYIPL